MGNTKIITSEYVSYGHPDKVADQISDALLDAYIEQDKNTRAGVETMIKDNIIVIGGEVKTKAKINIDEIVRNVMDNVGYPSSHHLSGEEVKVINLIGKQSNEISNGVDSDETDEIGAGDQGFVVGMASNETEQYLPLGVYIARQICNAVNIYDDFGPDIKTQVCVEYGGLHANVKTIIVSTMHNPIFHTKEIRAMIISNIKENLVLGNKIMDDVIFDEYIKGKNIEFIINENGDWNIGGPISDCGLTGRKIVVDQYGGYCNVGGGAFSGKDMSKVDRSAAYMCRYLAKNIVDAGLADEAKVELSYVISRAEPCSIKVDLVNPTNTEIGDLSKQIEKYIKENISLSPNGIIKRFFPCGVKPIFYNTARNGHFGYTFNDCWYPWEKLDLSDKLRDYITEVEISLIEELI